MIYGAIFFALSTAFWGYVTFRDARWVADDEGPAVWDYAFFGVLMCGASAVFSILCLFGALA